jgi:hypothetical protein
MSQRTQLLGHSQAGARMAFPAVVHALAYLASTTDVSLESLVYQIVGSSKPFILTHYTVSTEEHTRVLLDATNLFVETEDEQPLT